MTSSRDSLDFTESEAQLGVIRLDYHATHLWDAVLEGRILDIGNGTIRREGGLAGTSMSWVNFNPVAQNVQEGRGLNAAFFYCDSKLYEN